ncbi:hypothetical protein CVT24_011611, partial [Panaeolus cyanescens]
VRRTTRVLRSAKDAENANARPSRIATRAKTAGGATATTATSRLTAQTVASKAKSINPDGQAESSGAKRKRGALAEVTANVANFDKAAGSKDKEKAQADPIAKAKSIPKPVTKKPRVNALQTVATRRVVRSTTTRSAVLKAEAQASSKVKVDDGPAKMDVDEPAETLKKAPEIAEPEPVFKKQVVEEAPKVEEQDVSQEDADKVAEELAQVEAPSTVQDWVDIDADDWDDPASVNEYVLEICEYLKEAELATMPRADYMNDQEELNWDHRGLLMDWILQVHARFNLLAESLFLTVNIIDRFLSKRAVNMAKLQLVGIAAFFIATKYEETYAPSVKDIAMLAENAFSPEEILTAEKYILKTLNWDLRTPGPMNWLRRGSKADDCESKARTIAKYLIEIGCVEHRMVGILPSKVAAAGLWLARLTLGREEWTPTLQHYSMYSEQELIPVAKIMLEYILTYPVQHESLFRKYSSKRFFKCSVYLQQWAMDRWPENTEVDLEHDIPQVKEEIRIARLAWEAEQEALKAAAAAAEAAAS